MSASRTQLITALEQTHPVLVRLTSTLTASALDFQPTPHDWSIRGILAHLVDDEMYVMRTRLERIVKENHPHLTPNDEKQWFASRNTTRDELTDLLADFNLQRSASLGIIKMLRESDWIRQGYQPEYGHFMAEAWLVHWVTHDSSHIHQIETNLTAYQATSRA